MFLLTSSSIYTPLLKIPILLTSNAFTYVATGVPNIAPPKDPKQVGVDYVTRNSPLQLAIASVAMAVFSGLTIFEVVAITAQTYPHAPLSDAVLAALTPSGRTPDLRITPTFLCGVTLNIAGAVLRAWSFKTLGVFFTGPVFIRRDQRLITTGPYAFVRHPSYTGALAIVVGPVLALFVSKGSYAAHALGTDAWWSLPARAAFWALMGWRVVVTGYLLPRRAIDEDRLLREEFGEEWEVYARRTPYRMCPYIW